MLFAAIRILLVWVGGLAFVSSQANDIRDANLILFMLVIFYGIPVLLFLALLYLVETKLFETTLPMMGLLLGPLVSGLAWVDATGPIGELALPMGMIWLATGIIRAFRFRPPPVWP